MNFSNNGNGMTSPTSKMKILNDRWQQIQHQMDRQKQFRQQNLQEQLMILDNKLTHMKPIHHQKTEIVLQKIQKLKDDSKEISIRKKQSNQQFEEKIKKLEDNIGQQIEKQNSERMQKVQTWIKESDQKLIEICNDLQEVTNQKSTTVDMITQKMKKRIFDLEQLVQTEGGKREQNTTQITQAIQKQLNRLHNEIDLQKRSRQEANRKLLHMVRQIQQKIQQEIQEQKRARRQTNQALLGLLQQTCLKVEKAFY